MGIIKFLQTRNKSVRFLYNRQNNKKLLIFACNYSYFKNLKQRPNHLLNTFAKHGYIIAWLNNSIKRPVEIESNVFLIPKKDTKNIIFSPILKDKVVITLSTYYTSKNLEKILFKAAKQGTKIIYEHLDDIELVENKKFRKILQKRFEKMCANPNILITTSAQRLYNQACQYSTSKNNIILAKNAVNIEDFKNNTDENFEKFLSENKPIIGYYGAINKRWFDFQMLEYGIKNNPHLNFVLIGIHDQNDIEPLKKYNNFLCLDKMSYEKLKNYSKHFSVGLVPFLINDITLGTSPVKIFEYMAQGIPVVSSALPECKLYKSCLIANNNEEFSQLINKAVTLKNDENYKKILKEEANANTWEKVYQTIAEGIK